MSAALAPAEISPGKRASLSLLLPAVIDLDSEVMEAKNQGEREGKKTRGLNLCSSNCIQAASGVAVLFARSALSSLTAAAVAAWPRLPLGSNLTASRANEIK